MRIRFAKAALIAGLYVSSALVSFNVFAISASSSIDQLSSQVSPLWQSMKPACVMALDLNTQGSIGDRLELLDNQLVASGLSNHLKPLAKDRNTAWSNQVWTLRETLEQSALSAEEREPLREYFFKLQTQTPNADRAKLVADVQYMSEQLNKTLRKELWKTCHALGIETMAQEQLETAVEQRWLKQAKKVNNQLKKELAAFYFYSFRQVQNMELAVLAKTAAALNPWVDATAESIEAYFLQLRGELLATELKAMAVEPVTDKPFLQPKPWAPSNQKSPFN